MGDCQSGQEVLNALRQVQKLLSAHETSFLQNLRSLHKKLSLLQNSTVKHNSSTDKTSTVVDTTVNNDASASISASSHRPASVSTHVRASRCIEFLDSTHCTDIELFRLTRPGHLCLYTCVNTAGSFHCECPAGYSLGRDSRSCHGVATATLASKETTSVSRLRSPLTSNMSTPTVLFRLSVARILGDTLSFGLLGTRGVQHFSVQCSGRLMEQLVLVNSLQGPATLEVDIETSERERRVLLRRYVTKVTLFVSPYKF